MLLFLASVLDQLDLALEHIQKGNMHDARFGMMLTDNALELVLHQIAKDKVADLKMWSFKQEEYRHQAALDEALRRKFDAKVKFAKIEAGLSEELAQTITILHSYRNEVYHIGLTHEAILPALSRFYFDVTCTFLATYEPRFFSWGSNQVLPERAKKYFNSSRYFPGDAGDFGKGCVSLRSACGHEPALTIETLADEMDAIISQQDTCIDIVADGVYKGQRTTRDGAVLDTQAWRLAFSKEGKAFAQSRGYTDHMLKLPEWLRDHYQFELTTDPIPSWTARARRLRANKNPHSVLSTYQAFLASTEDIREALAESAEAAEREIDRLIDMKRGK